MRKSRRSRVAAGFMPAFPQPRNCQVILARSRSCDLEDTVFMRLNSSIIASITLVSIVALRPVQIIRSQSKSPVKPEEIVRLWFERWNALDGSEQATNKLLELY